MPHSREGGPSPGEMGLTKEQAEISTASKPESLSPQQELATKFRQQSIEEAMRQGWTPEDLERKYDLAILETRGGSARGRGMVTKIEGVIDGQHIEVSWGGGGRQGGSIYGTREGKELSGAEAMNLFFKYKPIAELQGNYIENKAMLGVIHERQKESKQKE